MDILEKAFPHLQNWEKSRKGKFTLKNIKNETKLFGNPQFKFKTIHIAGSKGKGTLANLLSLILKYAGFKVGTFTSPHLFNITERIQYNCKPIPTQEFSSYCKLIKKTIKNYKKETDLTYFEILTLLSFLYFKDKNTDYGIFETGIGGKLDATNIIESQFQVITSIEYEHTDILGTTLEKIFLEKAGIGKSQTPLLVIEGWKNFLPFLQNLYEKKHNNIFLFGRDFYIQRHKNIFEYYGLYDTYQFNFPPTINRKNDILIASAMYITEYLTGKKIEKKWIEKAITKIDSLYRLKIISAQPLIIVDVAHTRQSIKNLVYSVKEKYKNKKFYILFSTMKGKDVVGMLFFLKNIAKKFIFFGRDDKKFYTAEELYNLNNLYIGSDAESFRTSSEAVQYITQNNLYPIIICGSFYNISTIFKNFSIYNKKLVLA